MRRLRWWLSSMLVGGFSAAVSAFDTFTDESGIYLVAWERGTVPMQLNLPTSPTYGDGTSARSNLEDAMRVWNSQIGNVQFTWEYGEEGVYEIGNEINEIVMDSTIAGFDFGSRTLAVALSVNDGNYRKESDLIFNTAWTWDSYRGDLQREVVDIQRVALHELGHNLGLAHPDQDDPPQYVTALMNSVISDLDGLQADDIAGAHFLYGAPGDLPPNDDFEDAVEISITQGGIVTLQGTNVQASAQSDEPILDTEYPGGRTVWWKWTAPEKSKVNVSTLGSQFDTVLGVFTGSELNGLVQVGINDDIDPGIIRTSSVGFIAEAGATYYFLVDGWDGFEAAIEITLRLLNPPPSIVGINHPRVVGTMGEPLELRVTATSELGEELTYQWRFGSRNIPGATSSRYTLANFSNADAGAYSVKVTEPSGGTSYVTAFVLPDYARTTVQVWGGFSGSGITSVPDSLVDAVSIAPGPNHALALRVTGEVVGWGAEIENTAKGQERPPHWLDDAVAIAAGSSHSLALRDNGTVVAWGADGKAATTVPEGLKEVVAISADDSYNAALRADGTVVSWWMTAADVFGVSNFNDAVDIKVSRNRIIVLHEGGRVSSWNFRLDSQWELPTLPPAKAVFAMSAGLLVLQENGRLTGYSELALGDLDQFFEVNDVKEVVLDSIGIGYVLKNDGNVITVPDVEGPGLLGVDLDALDRVLAIGHRGFTFMALSTVEAVRPPVLESVSPSVTLVQGQTLRLEVKVSGDDPFSYQWKKDGVEVGNSERIGGAMSSTLVVVLTELADAGDYTVEVSNAAGVVSSDPIAIQISGLATFTLRPLTQIAVEGDAVQFNAAVTGTGTLTYQWWHDGNKLTGENSPTLQLVNLTLAATGRYSLQVIDERGAVWTQAFLKVGAIDGEVVVWDTDKYSTQGEVPSTNLPIVRLEVYQHAVALQSDGTILGWGYAFSVAAAVPEGLEDVVDIAVGDSHTLVLLANGTVVAWGRNTYGQVDVPEGLNEVIAIEAGSRVSLALKANGELVAWGRDVLIALPELLTDVVDMSLDVGSGLLLQRDGSLQSWSASSRAPVVEENIRSISAGNLRQIVLLETGRLVTWGGFSSSGNEPLDQLTDIVALDQGLSGGLALDRTGTLFDWTSQGVLKDDSTQWNNVVDVAAGNFRAAIVRAILPVVNSTPSAIDISSGEDLIIPFEVNRGGALVYEWFRDGEALELSARITVAADGELRVRVARADESGVYTVKVSNAAGAVVSSPVAVLVRPRPVPLQWPTNRRVTLGTETVVDLSTADSDVEYVWRHKGELMDPQPGAVLRLADTQIMDAGYYDVTMTAESGGVLAVGFTLVVVPDDGVIVKWGSGSGVFVKIPAGLGNVVQFSWNGRRGMALTKDGTIVPMQGTVNGEEWKLPSDLQDVVQVSMGADHGLALESDGTVRAWSFNPQIDYLVPENLPPIASISANGSTSLALSAEGEVYVWDGSDATASDPKSHARIAVAVSRERGGYAVATLAGEIEIVPYSREVNLPPIPSDLSDVVGLSSNGRDVVAVTKDGGTEFLPGGLSYFSAGFEVEWSDIRHVSLGYQHILGIDSQGAGLSAGTNTAGEGVVPSGAGRLFQVGALTQNSLGLVAGDPQRLTIMVPPRGKVVKGGQAFSLTVEARGAGDLTYQWFFEGQALQDGFGVTGATSPSVSIDSAAEFNSGSYRVQITDSSAAVESAPVAVEVVPQDAAPIWQVRPVTQLLEEGQPATFSGTTSGAERYQWRFMRSRIPGETTADLQLNPVKASDEGYYEVYAISSGGAVSRSVFYITVAPANIVLEQVELFGTQGFDIPADVGEPAAVYASRNQNFVLRKDGTVKVWGPSADLISEEVTAMSDVTVMAASYRFAVAIKGSGRVALLGEYLDSYIEDPESLDLVTGAVAVSGGDRHFLVLHADGSVSAFGEDYKGQSSVPEGLSNVVAIAATSSRSLALRGDGELVVWGNSDNSLGQDEIPANLGEVIRIDGGTYFNLAMLEDRSLVTWGSSSNAPSIPSGLGPVRDFSTRSGLVVITLDGNVEYIPPYSTQTVVGDLSKVVRLAPLHPRWLALVLDERPTLEEQPADAALTEGQAAQFEIVVSGVGALTYQWRFNGVNLADGVRISGAQSAVLRITDLSLEDRGRYDVVVTDEVGTTISRKAFLYPLEPRILEHPDTQVSDTGRYAALEVTTEASPLPQTYQWYRGESGDTTFPVEGFDFAKSVILEGTETGKYWCRVSNEFSSVDSNAATLVWFEKIGEIGSSSYPSLFQREGQYLAMGYDGISTSIDGVTWTSITEQHFLQGALASGNGNHVFAGWNHSYYSTDLVTWQPLSIEIKDVVFDGAAFIGVNSNGIHRSLNGIEWTQVDSTAATYLLQGGGWVIAIGDQALMKRSSDGLVWATLNKPGFTTPIRKIYAEGEFRVWNRDGRLMASTNGESWSQKWTVPGSTTNFKIKGMVHGQGMTLALDPGDAYWVSEDFGNGRNTFGSPQSMLFDGERFLYVSTGGDLFATTRLGTDYDPSAWQTDLLTEPGNPVSIRALRDESTARIQWFEGKSGDTEYPLINDAGPEIEVNPAVTTEYWARIILGIETLDTETVRVRVEAKPPVITAFSGNAVVEVGTNHRFEVSATGTAPLRYQWFREGQLITGVNQSILELAQVGLADAGRYFVEVSNQADVVRSTEMVLSVLPTGFGSSATHESLVYRYVPGGSVTIDCELNFDETVSAASWSVLLPEGWALAVVRNDGLSATSEPMVGDQDLLEWSWTAMGDSPVAFSIILDVTTNQRGVAEIISLVGVTSSGVEVQLLAHPDPLEISPALHTADMDGDQKISLTELLRVIELYNTRFGSSRTGRYRLAESSIDGFEPDVRDLNMGTVNTRFHSADYSRDGRLGLSELLRVIELYNTRSGSRRTGAYELQTDSVDGFRAGSE
jgi:alpha-tubulin suppressor-like RCC1 family protein